MYPKSVHYLPIAMSVMVLFFALTVFSYSMLEHPKFQLLVAAIFVTIYYPNLYLLVILISPININQRNSRFLLTWLFLKYLIYVMSTVWCLHGCLCKDVKSLEAGLQTVVSIYIGTDNWTQVSWKISHCS